MFVPDPLLEEAAYLAAAVREGSLSASALMRLVQARIEAADDMATRFDMANALQHAAEIDVAPAQATALALPGVPFLVVGRGPDAPIASLEQAGAIRLDATGLSLIDAARAVAAGIAAFVVSFESDAESLAVFGVRALLPIGGSRAFLARSCRDLAVVADAAELGAGAGDALCRRLTDDVGRGTGSLAIAVVAGAGLEKLNGKIGMPAALTPVDELNPADLGRFDAIITRRRAPLTRTQFAQLFLPHEHERAGALRVLARHTEAAIRIGAVLDAEQLKTG